MHSECMEEMATKIKNIRREVQEKARRCGVGLGYDSPGEMRGYFKVLELICPNPMED